MTNWIALIASAIAAVYPVEPTLPHTIGTSLCILAVAANAYVIGIRSR